MPKKAVRIACRGAETRRLGQLVEFQGDLKALTPENAAKLRREILELGFSEPVAVWPHRGKSYVLNGHQRLRVLRELEAEGYTVPPIPVNIVRARSRQEAKRKVLALTSQYGAIRADGLRDVAEEAGLSIEDLAERFRFLEVDFRALAARAGIVSERPEVEISPELFERHDYLVVYFDNEFDWRVACEALEIRTVRDVPKGKCSLKPKRGTGRVIPARRLLDLLGVAADD